MESGKSRGRSVSAKPKTASRAASKSAAANKPKSRAVSRSKKANASMNAAAMMKQIANLQAALQKITTATKNVVELPKPASINSAPGTSKRNAYEKSVKNVMGELGIAYRNAQKVVKERAAATKKSKPMPKGALNTMNLARTLRNANPNMKWTNAMKAASVQRKAANAGPKSRASSVSRRAPSVSRKASKGNANNVPTFLNLKRRGIKPKAE
jgi:hypothetical protein